MEFGILVERGLVDVRMDWRGFGGRVVLRRRSRDMLLYEGAWLDSASRRGRRSDSFKCNGGSV